MVWTLLEIWREKNLLKLTNLTVNNGIPQPTNSFTLKINYQKYTEPIIDTQRLPKWKEKFIFDNIFSYILI